MKFGEFVIVLAVILLMTMVSLLGKAATEQRMKRQSLEGYKAIATYTTNSLGEVSISKVDWIKK